MPAISDAERALRFICLPLARAIYRVKAVGLERLPRGGFLLLPNHITWVDAIILLIACPRPIRFMIAEEFYHNRYLHWVLNLTRAIPITPRRAKEAMRLAAEMVRDGEIVCVFPEGQLTRSGVLGTLRRCGSTSFGARYSPTRVDGFFVNGHVIFLTRRWSNLEHLSRLTMPISPRCGSSS
jgi:1-acyl-sn-glycerol-3-phosphate acyltransferase